MMIFYRVSLITVYAQLPDIVKGNCQETKAVKQESGVMCGRKDDEPLL